MPENEEPDLLTAVRLRRDLIADGLTDNQIARLVRHRVLERIRHGAYVDAQLWHRLSAEGRHRLRARAVLCITHDSTALTHISSVVERGCPVWGLPLDVVHTSQTVRRKAARKTKDWTPHRGVLLPHEVEHVNGVPISVAARSAVEVCSIASVEAALVVVNGLLHAGAMTIEEFAAEAARCQHWPRSLTAHIVLRLADPRVESVGESRFAYLCYRQRLPKPQPQVEIFDEYGVLVGRVDFAWLEYGVYLEFDGKVKYELFRREGESLEDYLKREKEREEKICQLTGWVCIRITWADLARPERLAARIRAILDRRGPASVDQA